MKRKALFTFIRLAILKKIAFYRRVIELMTNNPNFPNPDVPIAELQAIVDRLEHAYFEYQNGSHVAKATMDNLEQEADELFRRQGEYVTRIANGDVAIILSAGYEASAEPKPRQVPEFSVADGDLPGSLVVRRLAVTGARSYVWQYCLNELPKSESGWLQAAITTSATYEMYNLEAGVRVFLRVAAITADGQGPFTQPISRIPQ